MKAKLRGHHLICLNFFRGEGYSDDFIKNIYNVIRKEKIIIVEGTDEVCSICPYLKGNKCESHEYTNEMIIFQDREALRLLGFKSGMMIDWEAISAKLPAIIDMWKSEFCVNCGYQEICFG